VLSALEDQRAITTSPVRVDKAQARAWTAVARGDVGQACGLLLAAADEGEQIGDLVGAAARRCTRSPARGGPLRW
jgi:hypothetical protein